jgi:hypothetical protein
MVVLLHKLEQMWTKWSWASLRHYSGIFLQELVQTKKNHSQGSQCSDRDSNKAPTESHALPLQPTCSAGQYFRTSSLAILLCFTYFLSKSRLLRVTIYINSFSSSSSTLFLLTFCSLPLWWYAEFSTLFVYLSELLLSFRAHFDPPSHGSAYPNWSWSRQQIITATASRHGNASSAKQLLNIWNFSFRLPNKHGSL